MEPQLENGSSAMDLRGKVALVTGASRGIGRAIALALAQAGADVAVNFKSKELEANSLVGRIGVLHQRAVSIRADVSREEDVARLVRETVDALGPIDILVNNAGIAHPVDLHTMQVADWDNTMAQNLRSAFLVSQAVLPGMRSRQWGRLLFLGSVAAQVGGVIGPDYAASKAGLVGLMHYYASHLAKEGITANLLAPARVETDMVMGTLAASVHQIPVGRLGSVDEVATMAVAVLGNGYLTGQSIHINGGWYPTS
ncbi:MAG: SDR family NAD(P)-dependent oxidoreductase [Bryobacterales bacterium]|nr:SDR family NAD(P)-dependent oxidoreductase [Bryobacterales bacterium]